MRRLISGVVGAFGLGRGIRRGRGASRRGSGVLMHLERLWGPNLSYLFGRVKVAWTRCILWYGGWSLLGRGRCDRAGATVTLHGNGQPVGRQSELVVRSSRTGGAPASGKQLMNASVVRRHGEVAGF